MGYSIESVLSGRKAALLATVSICAVLSGQANAQTEAPIEEVVVTGSLIRGAAVVGVPVTTLSQEDFQKTGAITVTDLLKSVPGVFVTPSLSPSGPPGNFVRTSTMDIHGLNPSNNSQRTLILIDGVRYAYSGQGGERGDISFLPQLAVSSVDVVATGASAIYGSDALTGVINVILRRNFDGAISEVSAGTPEGGGFHWTASQLYGRSWDSGNITLAFTHYDQHRLAATKRPNQFTTDFRPWGLEDATDLRISTPGVVSIGSPPPFSPPFFSPFPDPGPFPDNVGCENCFTIPKGQGNVPGSLSWATLLANPGVTNTESPFLRADAIPAQQTNSISAVFDQDLWPGVHLFGEAYYANRRGRELTPPIVGHAGVFARFTVTVPTTNPFYPVGIPPVGAEDGVQVSTNLTNELQPINSFFEINGRYSLGLHFELPRGWEGKVQATQSAVNNGYVVANEPNPNNVNAALGHTVVIPASGNIPEQTLIKPASIPYLNLFCDPTGQPQFFCNSKATLDYINGTEVTLAHQILNQYDASFDGPVWTLPGGEMRLAVGASLIRNNMNASTQTSQSATSVQLPITQRAVETKRSYAFFGELHIPIFGEENAIPFFQKLELQLSERYDNYDKYGTTTNPRVAIDWVPVDGLTLRGAWGRSFRTPGFVDLLEFPHIRPLNAIVGGTPGGQITFDACATDPDTGDLFAVPGSIGAILNPTCDPTLNFPGGVSAEGGSDTNGIFPRGGATPEKSEDYTLGFRYAPTDNFLTGLSVDVAYWNIQIRGLLGAFRTFGFDIAGVPPNPLQDPNFASVMLVNDGSAAFLENVNRLIASPDVAGQFAPGAATNVQFIWDGFVRNLGSLKADGIDFSVTYDWAGGDLGDWSLGVLGTYFLNRKTQNDEASPPNDVFDAPGTAFIDGVPFGGFFGPGVEGQSQAVRLRYRGYIGWTMDNLSITTFVNYRSHFFTVSGDLPPIGTMLANGITNFSYHVPALYTVDLALSYDFGDQPANDYLKNIRLGLVVNNILDKKPPFNYTNLPFVGTTAFAGEVDNPIGRDFTFTITKTW